MARLNDIVSYCNDLLQPDRFSDYCPNGLQVEGKPEVRILVTGVTASQALIERAVEKNADAILVHHGYFWKGENACITGMKYRRLKLLIENGISLIAYHLPLDAHPVVGNNAQLGRVLSFNDFTAHGEGQGTDLLFYTHLEESMAATGLSSRIEEALHRPPLHIAGGKSQISRIGWCTGGAQTYIDQAADLGLDAFITGEVSEQTTHIALERGIHFYAAGHHATESYGVQALGHRLNESFSLNHINIDVFNPV